MGTFPTCFAALILFIPICVLSAPGNIPEVHGKPINLNANDPGTKSASNHSGVTTPTVGGVKILQNKHDMIVVEIPMDACVYEIKIDPKRPDKQYQAMIWDHGSPNETPTFEQTRHVAKYKKNPTTALPCLCDAEEPNQNGRQTTGNFQTTVTFDDGNAGIQVGQFSGTLSGLTFGPGGMTVGGEPIQRGKTINYAHGIKDIIDNGNEKTESRCTAKSSADSDVDKIQLSEITVTKTSSGMVLIEVLRNACVFVSNAEGSDTFLWFNGSRIGSGFLSTEQSEKIEEYKDKKQELPNLCI